MEGIKPTNSNPEKCPLTREAFYSGMIEGLRVAYSQVLESKDKEIRKLDNRIRMIIHARSYQEVGEVLRDIRIDDEVEYQSDLKQSEDDNDAISVFSSDDEKKEE